MDTGDKVTTELERLKPGETIDLETLWLIMVQFLIKGRFQYDGPCKEELCKEGRVRRAV